jgi:uncharacterized membrane protein
MTLVWGAIGFSFARFCPLISKGLSHYEHGIYRTIIIVLSVFMLVNMIFTAICIFRWSRRHQGVAPVSAFEEFLDRNYDDDYMANRFMDWWFIDQKHEEHKAP